MWASTWYRYDDVMSSMTYDWAEIVKAMRNSIVRAPKKGLSLKSYVFAKERVVLQSQTYRQVYFNLLLQKYLFGNNYNKIPSHQIHMQIIQICSSQYFQLLLSEEIE